MAKSQFSVACLRDFPRSDWGRMALVYSDRHPSFYENRKFLRKFRSRRCGIRNRGRLEAVAGNLCPRNIGNLGCFIGNDNRFNSHLVVQRDSRAMGRRFKWRHMFSAEPLGNRAFAVDRDCVGGRGLNFSHVNEYAL